MTTTHRPKPIHFFHGTSFAMKKNLFFTLSAVALIACNVHPVHAGQWAVKHLVYSCSYNNTSGTVYFGQPGPTGDFHYSGGSNGVGGTGTSDDQTRYAWNTVTTENTIFLHDVPPLWFTSGPEPEPPLATANVGDAAPLGGESIYKLTVQPVFKWEPDNASDGPPDHVTYVEDSYSGIERAAFDLLTGPSYVSVAEGYDGHDFEIMDKKCGLERIGQVKTIKYQYIGAISNTVAGLRVTSIPSGGKSEVAGPTRDLKADVRAINLKFESWHQAKQAQISLYYRAQILDYSVKVRRLGTEDGFASEATVAAGAKDPDEHIAEVQISTSPVVPNYPLQLNPQVLFGDGVQANAVLTRRHGAQTGTSANGTPIYAPLVTDAEGKVIIGTLRSSDKIKLAPAQDKKDRRMKIKMPVTNGQNDPGARMNQQWATVEWKMGENGEKEYNTAFILEDSDYTEWVWTKVKAVADKPLIGHTMKFIPNRLVVREWDAGIPQLITKIFTTNEAEIAQHAGDAAYQVTFSEDITGVVGPYIILPETLTAEADGVYKGPITIKHSDDFSVTSYQLALEDQGAFKRKSP